MIIHIWKSFIVTLEVVVVLVDPADATHSDHILALLDLNYATGPNVVNVLRDPAAIVQVSQQVRGLMVAANKDCQDGGSLFLSKVPMELTHSLVFGWAFQRIQVFLGPETLYNY